jgi:cellulose biosynthesis protein BcsQ
MMAAKIISITNQKGGVGKSTTTMLIAGGFAKKHLRVLVD